MNYCIMRYFWSKGLATILSNLLTITVAFYVVLALRTKYPFGEEGHSLNVNTLLSRETIYLLIETFKKKKNLVKGMF